MTRHKDWKLIVPANCISFPEINSEGFQSLLASGRRETLCFFLKSLEEIISPIPHPRISTDQINYTAKFLTQFSLNSAMQYLPPQKTFLLFFPTFESLIKKCGELTAREDLLRNTRFLEWVACQMLLLSGFYFENAIHTLNRSEIEELGREYFLVVSTKSKRSKLFRGMAKNFRQWQDFLCYMHWHFQKMREDSLIIRTPKPEEPIIKIVLE